MKANSSNVFPGAKVKKGGEEYTVIKVNEKSLYVSSMSWKDYQYEWGMKLKGTTFKKFCEMFDIRMDKYNDYEIDDSEAVKKEAITSNDYKLDAAYSLVLNENVKDFAKKKRSIKLQTLYCEKGFVRVLEERDGCYMLNVNNKYVLHCLDTGESYLVCNVSDYKHTPIPWEKLSKFSCVAS